MIDALPLLLGPEGYQISRSVRLRSSASAYFNRTPASAGNRQKWTYRAMLKRGSITAQSSLISARTDDNNRDVFQFQADATLQLVNVVGGSATTNLVTTSVYRDPSSFYDILLAVDTTQATAANRVKLYINGTQITAFSTATYPAQNANFMINAAVAHGIGRFEFSSPGGYYDGLLTEMYLIDGQQLDPSSFGETNPVTGVWQPKKYTGTYGTNGFYLNFADNSAATAAAIGKDYSGNGNNWTPNNISVTAGVTYDSMLDVPTQWADGGNGRGNYATLNPLSGPALPSTITNGNLTATTASTAFSLTSASMAMLSGKWYCEVKFSSLAIGAFVGIRNSAEAPTSYVGGTSGSYGYYSTNGNKYNAGTAGSYGSSYTTSHTIGIAFDADAGSLTFYRDNVSQGVAYSSIPAADWVFAFSDEGTGSVAFDVNFGQRPFAYTPPTGFKALNTLNLPTPTILKGNQYFDATTYTANASSQTISSLQFQPDFLWIKSRSGAYSNILQDSVRGATAQLFSNLTNAEFTGTDRVQSFTSNGWTMGADAAFGVNAPNGATQVAWSWKEGPTQGFDIVTYTGTGANRTVSHSLGVAPSMIIVKSRSISPSSWSVYHASIGAGNELLLNSTAASVAAANAWNNTAPTSTVFSLGTGASVNQNTATYVAYLFSEVAGFSRFGSYTGNGSADGPFVFCGFRPRWIMWKKTNSATNAPWVIVDTSRSPYNLAREYLLPNASDAETSVDLIDVLSNGFKWRGTAPGGNNSGDTYIFAAFAEHPFKNALAR